MIHYITQSKTAMLTGCGRALPPDQARLRSTGRVHAALIRVTQQVGESLALGQCVASSQVCRGPRCTALGTAFSKTCGAMTAKEAQEICGMPVG